MHFSIIIPVYNVEAYLSQCLDSVLSQSFTDFELIIVDDGSTDECPGICDQYADQDSRAVVIHKTNGGLSDARNAGMKMARGDYIVFLDSDDYWDGSECLSDLHEAIKDDPDIVLFMAKKLFDSSGRVVNSGKSFHSINADWDCPSELLLQLVKHDLFRCSAWCKTIRRDLLVDNRIEFEKGILSEDIPWYLRIILHAKRYAFVDRDFYVYRQRPGSITKSLTLKNLRDFIYVIKICVERAQQYEIPNDLRLVSFAYLAKEFSQLLIVYAQIDDGNKMKYKEEIISYAWLLRHAISNRPKLVKLTYNLFGLDATTLLLRWSCFLKGKKRLSSPPAKSTIKNQIT